MYILLGNRDEEVFFGLSLGPKVEPAPVITLTPLPLLFTLWAKLANEDDVFVGAILSEGSLLIFVLADKAKEVILLRSFAMIGVLLSLIRLLLLLLLMLILFAA